ncbi:MAG: hypothetical protein ACOC0J_01150, partial [Myxococcota bacterium]
RMGLGAANQIPFGWAADPLQAAVSGREADAPSYPAGDAVIGAANLALSAISNVFDEDLKINDPSTWEGEILSDDPERWRKAAESAAELFLFFNKMPSRSPMRHYRWAREEGLPALTGESPVERDEMTDFLANAVYGKRYKNSRTPFHLPDMLRGDSKQRRLPPPREEP